MAKQNSGNKMWIAGAVFGAVAGAAYALWKTPMSGEELRGKLSTGPVSQSDTVKTDSVHTPNAGDKILGKLEQAMAPIVGVQLGKTANGPAPTNGVANGTATEPIAVATPPAEAAAKAEPAAVEATAASTTEYGGESFRTKRYEWGTPAPEATEAAAPTQATAPVEPVEPVEPAAPIVQEVVDKATESEAETASTNYGSQTLRSRQYGWGEPAPEATASESTATAATATAEPEANQASTDQLATAGASTSAGTSPIEAVSDAAATAANKRQFPKLGGLEK